MKKDLYIEETDRVWNGREWMTRSEAREQARQMRQDYKEGRLRNGLYRFGRKGNNPEALAQMRTAMIVDVHRRQWAGNQELQEEMRRLHEAITAREATGVSQLPTDTDRQQWHDRYFSDATASGC
jgi:hypothetical protein